MIPATGTYAAYSFTPHFSSLNGIYTVSKVQSYSNALKEDVDFKKDLYAKVGLSDAQFEADSSLYIGDDVYFLEDTSGETIYPVPESLIATEPDTSVGKYHNLYMKIYLGYWNDPNRLSWLKAMINDIVTQSTGSSNNAEIHFAEPDTIWMKESEYQLMDEARKSAAKSLNPMSQQIKDLQDDVTSLKSQNQYLRQMLITAGVTNKT